MHRVRAFREGEIDEGISAGAGAPRGGRLAGALWLSVALAAGSASAQGVGDLPATALDEASLDAQRGRAGDTRITLESNQDLRSTVNGSVIQAGSMVSGAVTIEERAMDNFSGIGLFNIVTGSNNAVDAAIGINFNLQ